MANIAITMTATTRPEIIKKTLYSFNEFMFKSFINNNGESSLRLIINIDHCLEKEAFSFFEYEYSKRREMYLLCKEIFNDNIVCRHSFTPSFPIAFKWVWETAIGVNRYTAQTWEADYIFHLEDDWELLRPINLDNMVSLINKNPKLLILRLSQFPTGSRTSKNWNKLINWNGDYFQVPDDLRGLLGFCGHPSLIKPLFIREALKVLDGEHNPEKHIKGHSPIMKPLYDNYLFGVFSPQNSGPTIKDIGRAWMIEKGYRKQGTKAFFTKWEEKNG